MRNNLLLVIGCGLIVVAATFVGQHSLSAQADATQKLKPLPRFLRNEKLAERYLRTRDIETILQFERVRPVCLQLISRADVPKKNRLEAIHELAKLEDENPAKLLVDHVAALDKANDKKNLPVLDDLSDVLLELGRDALSQTKEPLLELVKHAKHDSLRQSALVAIASADRSFNTVWDLANERDAGLLDLLRAAMRLEDVALRKSAFEKVLPLIQDDSRPVIQRAAIEAIGSLDGDMESVFLKLAELIERGQHIDVCISTIAKIPRNSWDVTKAPQLAEAILRFADSLPIVDRTTDAGKTSIELVQSMASLVPESERDILLDRVSRIRVQQFQIKTLEEKMSYDQTVIIAESGRAVLIRFQNQDIMPHNFVVGSEPKARVELGLMADDMQNDKDALAKGYLPDSDMVLFASKMVESGKEDTVAFTAPAVGIYPFVCTFPGHWSKMYGAMKVVDDAQSYLAANPKLPTADDLLGIQKVEWTLEQLTSGLDMFEDGRSFDQGATLFRQASCASCHKMKEQGGTIGPDLTEIAKKYKTPNEILLHIIEPSKSIDEKFASLTVVDVDGLTHQGVVLRRTDEELFLLKNPLQDCTPTVIRLDDIEDEVPSKVSAMPEKLLNTLVDQSQVYDLIAYLMSGAEPDHRLYE